jgi:ribosome-binding factor A
MSVRTEKVASLIQKELAMFLSKELSGNNELGFVTVTEVRMTPDLRVARIYISIFGTELQRGKAMKYLENKKSQLRKHVGSTVKLRLTPELVFFNDTSLDNVQHLEELLKKIHKDDASLA